VEYGGDVGRKVSMEGIERKTYYILREREIIERKRDYRERKRDYIENESKEE
jgi:hypothetical protein